ncbi:MAG TPA: hypothetical protein VMA71_02620 [Alloacidobacterium sp.]|nr:hypothetical protein [Alloacidobacterium sp.]
MKFVRLLPCVARPAVHALFISISFSPGRKTDMGLCIALQFDSGEQTFLMSDERNLLGRILETLNEQEFPTLTSIDLYGDTTFNRLQVRRLLNELDVLLNQTWTANEQSLLQAVRAIGKKSQEDVHQYVVFIGD